jgi:hypothetical protein
MVARRAKIGLGPIGSAAKTHFSVSNHIPLQVVCCAAIGLIVQW